MKELKILWADDEIDLLKIHILLLREKGFEVITANNGDDAIELAEQHNFDIIFLDENMPGLSGLEALTQIKAIIPSTPVVMVTKSEEEDIMDEAIGSKIADYLIKPVNPKQILLSIKKHVDTKRLVSEKTTSSYQNEFGRLGYEINDCQTFEDWVNIYKKLVFWELELSRTSDNQMAEIFLMQKNDANNAFAKFIKNNYIDWFQSNGGKRPLMSHNLFREKIIPKLKNNEQVFLLLVDNLRYDQWKTIQPIVREFFDVAEETLFCSILPTATQYSRNAMFAGLMPSEIAKLYPELWLNDDEEGGKNLNEEKLLGKQLSRFGLNIRMYYDKIIHTGSGKKTANNLNNVLNYQMAVVVINFIDMLSHARTEMDMIRELASDEAAYRSLTASWFKHSPLLSLMQQLAEKKARVIITTDHGTIRVHNPVKVIGDRKTTTNLRYKQGKNLNYKQKEVFAVTKPQLIHLPASNLSTSYIFAQNEDFFAYPNNYNHYAKYYKNTFQHGGVSMEEMIIPYIELTPKK